MDNRLIYMKIIYQWSGVSIKMYIQRYIFGINIIPLRLSIGVCKCRIS